MRKMMTFVVFCSAFLLFANFSHEKPQLQEKAPDIRDGEKKPPGKNEKTFGEVIQDAKKMVGLFNLYLKEDKVYLEILPEQFGVMYLFIPTLWTSIGFRESGYPFPMKVFEWEKLDKKILLLWKNTRYAAKRSAHYKRSLKNAVPESIVHAFKIESEPHPERKSILISLDDLFFTDLSYLGEMFSSPQNPYSVDKGRTVWGKTRAFPGNVELEVKYSLASSKSRFDPSLPDARIFTARVRYSISELPVNNGYRPRLADDRIGYFNSKVYDYDRSGIDGTEVRFINRWNLEKKNPNENISEPKEPIVFWLENTIPLEYRKPIRDGLLEWNKAFEKAGFKNAIVVEQMPDDAEWDPADVRYNTVRWVASLTGEGGGGFGPSRVNPMSGQILDADVVIDAPLNFLFSYNVFDSPLKSILLNDEKTFLPGEMNPWYQDNVSLGFERDFGILEMLASGSIRDVKEVPREYLNNFLRFLACHEVGHTLGLRHNFKGSAAIALKDLHNTKLTAKESIGNSIMDYLPLNIAPKGTKQGDYWQKTVGAWDEWVIEYGYRPMDAKTPDDELPKLNEIASRSNEPKLIYGTDEDASNFGPYSVSIDPLSITWDLSDDPLAYSEQEIRRIKDLWKQLEERALFEGRSYVYLRSAFELSLSRYFRAMNRLAKWIGGIYHVRSHVGDPGNVLPHKVVEYKKQKQALDIIKANLFNPEAFTFDPEFIRKLQTDRFFDIPGSDVQDMASQGKFRFDFSLSSCLKQFYENILLSLYDPMRLHRIQDNEMRSSGEKFTLGDYMRELHSALWKELGEDKPVHVFRRIAQREHLKRLTAFVLNPPPPTQDDVIAISRYELKQLDKSMRQYLLRNPNVDLATRAHLDNCIDLVSEALKAVCTKGVK